MAVQIVDIGLDAVDQAVEGPAAKRVAEGERLSLKKKGLPATPVQWQRRGRGARVVELQDATINVGSHK